MVELELSIFASQCLQDARIPSPEVLQDITLAYESRRNQQQAKIIWTFKIPDARDKLKHLLATPRIIPPHHSHSEQWRCECLWG